MSEREWWATAPAWAKWHVWDAAGKTWFAVRPTWSKPFYAATGNWSTAVYDNDTNAEYLHYDTTPCPVEIDPSKTLRKRPKETSV